MSLAFALYYAVTNVSIAPLRSIPSHCGEQVSQLLFGEKVEVLLDSNNGWVKIRSAQDDYVGYCRKSQLEVIDKKLFRSPTKAFASGMDDKLLFPTSDQWLPIGSGLVGLKAGKINILGHAGKYRGKKAMAKNMAPTSATILSTLQHFMNAPYQWGGRSKAGVDCSGLSQLVFKMCGLFLPRDASQQALLGEEVPFMQDIQLGDLAFFDNDERNITHVGVLLDPSNIIHATDTTGRVVADRIDNDGIVSTVLRQRTHKLRIVKRYF